MPDMETPAVLFLTFNRLDPTRRVFEAIRQARPAKLYLASDGPRASRPEEAAKVAAVREFLTSSVEWPCEFKTLFRDSNLGCKRAVAEGITWFFENEPEGIILEDDCLPHPDFFPFCRELLARYREDATVNSICGSNIIGMSESDADYFFTMIGGVWGWASWRRAWGIYMDDIRPQFTEENWRTIRGHLQNRQLSDCIQQFLRQSVIEHNANSWGYPWLFARLLAGGKSAVPNSNLISNIGFSADATHTTQPDAPLSNLPVQSLPPPYRAPSDTSSRKFFDAAQVPYLRLPSIFRRLQRKILRLFNLLIFKNIGEKSK